MQKTEGQENAVHKSRTWSHCLRGSLCLVMTQLILEIGSFPFHQSAGKYISTRWSSIVRKQNKSKVRSTAEEEGEIGPMSGSFACWCDPSPEPPPLHVAGMAVLGRRPEGMGTAYLHHKLSSWLKSPLIFWYLLWRLRISKLLLFWFLRMEMAVKRVSCVVQTNLVTSHAFYYIFTNTFYTCHFPYQEVLSLLFLIGVFLISLTVTVNSLVPLRFLSAANWSVSALGSFQHVASCIAQAV